MFQIGFLDTKWAHDMNVTGYKNVYYADAGDAVITREYPPLRQLQDALATARVFTNAIEEEIRAIRINRNAVYMSFRLEKSVSAYIRNHLENDGYFVRSELCTSEYDSYGRVFIVPSFICK